MCIRDRNIGVSIGKKSFNDDLLIKNYTAILETLEKEKNSNTIKGDLIKSAFITSTMGVSYKLKLGKNISSPKIVLMDEPFQGLDLISTRDLQETIVNLQTEDNSRCCIISDHAARDLLNISDRAVILANKKIVAHGPPKDLLKNEEARNLYFGETFNIN